MSAEKIGALWNNTTKKGVKYLSGKINGKNIVIFPNDYKKDRSHPDWNVLPGRGRPDDYRSPFEREPGEEG